MGIGTFTNLATARMDTPLIQVLDIFAQRRISCVPVVDENSRAPAELKLCGVNCASLISSC